MRLQSLYIDQFKRLQYTLREKRRKYLHVLKKEKETLCTLILFIFSLLYGVFEFICF